MFTAPWWILDNTMIAAVLALIVALVCRVRRVPPVVRHALWLVVLIKLIAPPLVPGPIQIPVRWRLLAERWVASDGERTDRTRGVLPPRDMAATRPQRFQSPATEMQALEPSNHQTPPAVEAGAALLRDTRDAAGCRVYDRGTFQSPEEQPETASELPEAGRTGASDRYSIEARPRADLPSNDTAPFNAGPGDHIALVDSPQLIDARHDAAEPSPPPEGLKTTGSRPKSAATFVFVGFFGATCVVIGVQVSRLVNLRRLLTRARPAPGDFLSIVEDVAARVGVCAPQVRFSADIASPVVCAFRRPILLWPASRRAALHDNALRAVILHELAHLARGDHLVGWLELVAGCLWWWNPLFWYVRHQLHETAELACDAWVMALIPEGRRDYARALVDLAEFDSRGRRAALALGVAEGSKNLFERRLVMIMGTRVRHRMGNFGILGTGLLALLALPGCTAGQASEEPNVAAPAALATMDADAGDDPLLRISERGAVSAAPFVAAEQDPLDAANRTLPSAVDEPLSDNLGDPLLDPPPGLPANPPLLDPSSSSENDYPVAAGDAPTTGRPSNDDRLKRLEDRFDALLKELRDTKNPTYRKSLPPSSDAQSASPKPPQKGAKTLPSVLVKPGQPAGGDSFSNVRKPHRDGDVETVALTRATYKFPEAKARALKAFTEFLATNLSDEVEVRFKDSALQVTASAEDQAVIAQFIRLLQARGSAAPKPPRNGDDGGAAEESVRTKSGSRVGF